jgi:hypothetical protein
VKIKLKREEERGKKMKEGQDRKEEKRRAHIPRIKLDPVRPHVESN